MKKSRFAVFCLVATLSASIHTAAGQMINPVVQNSSSRAVPTRTAPAAKPIANVSIAPRIAPRPTSFTPRTFNSYTPRMAAQPRANLLPNHSPSVRTLNPTLAAINAQRNARTGEREAITLDPATRQRELRTLAEMREQRSFRNKDATLAALNTERQVTTRDPAARPRLETRESPRDATTKKWRNKDNHLGYGDACRRHWREWHDRNWWHNNCNTIIFVSSGYYFLDGSYWYPAWGYDPLQTYNDYDGPIYTYGDLLPDEVIANVQVALQDTGYYSGSITGSLDGETRAALANFQRDYGLPITGAIDEPTVETLGLYQTSSQFVTP
jgi:hypothetical protein